MRRHNRSAASLTVGVLTGLGASLTVGVLTGLAASLTVGVRIKKRCLVRIGWVQ